MQYIPFTGLLINDHQHHVTQQWKGAQLKSGTAGWVLYDYIYIYMAYIYT